MLRLSDKVRSTHTSDGAIALDIRGGRMFTFNATASRILELLKNGTGEKEIALMLVSEFSVDPATAKTDADEFLTLLRQHALIESRS